jgi:hypothetical protein
MRLSKGNLSGNQKLVLGLFFALPLLVVIGKWSLLPTCSLFERVFSLARVPDKMDSRVAYILFVPFGATLVVFFRLVLGIRLMGPFRSILIAIAFQITGILPGLVFLAIVVGAVAFIRPQTRAIRLPYFARVSVILSAVASIMILVLLSGSWLNIESLCRLAYFPIIALCLMGEGFARTLSKEGLKSALWRGLATVLVAIIITFFSQIEGLRSMFLYYPELLLCQIGCIVVIAEFFDLRLLSFLNPPKSKASSNEDTHSIGLVPA